ncbi:2-hydroxy-3-oxopropionate reductase [Nymphon striatum]|nr:2-hydroxy-3-oxopropionate reductase [Nymphon striatum]
MDALAYDRDLDLTITPSSNSRKITLIGTGLMGLPMSRNLMKAGHDLTVWNRSTHRAAPLVAEGAKTAVTADKAIAGAEVIITMLSDGFATEAMLADDAFRAALTSGMIWIDMSSAKPEHARAQSAQLAELGVAHLDAPVSGGTKGAEAGSLAIMVGGDARVFEAAQSVFKAMGHPVHVGPSGAGVAVTIAAVAEATLLVEKGGADPAALRAALKGGFADSVILQQHGQRMSEGDFAPGGLSKFQLKDLDNYARRSGLVGARATLHASLCGIGFAYFCEEMDGADLDHSGLYLELKKRNDLQ